MRLVLKRSSINVGTVTRWRQTLKHLKDVLNVEEARRPNITVAENAKVNKHTQ